MKKFMHVTILVLIASFIFSFINYITVGDTSKEEEKPTNITINPPTRHLPVTDTNINEDDVSLDKNDTIQSNFNKDITYTEEDLYYLSRFIFINYKDMSDEQQQKIGSIILNRVENAEYPNSVKDVVEQVGDNDYEIIPDEHSYNNAENVLKHGVGYYLCASIIEFEEGE